MKIRAVGDYAVLKPVRKDKTEGGIFIPASVQGPPVGVVVSPPGRRAEGFAHLKMVAKGDMVTYHKGLPFGVEGEEYIAVKAEDIIAVLEPDDPEESQDAS